MKKTRKAPTASEFERLRARLDEAEQTLDAIRSGNVDALVVAGPTGDRIFTLEGADHRYRRIVEKMTEGALIVGPQGSILYSNASFADLVASPLERVIGSQLTQYVPGSASATFARLLRSGSRDTAALDAGLLGARGRVVPVHVSAAPDADQEGSVCLIVTDLTEAMREAEERFQFVADMLPQIMWSARPDGWLDYYNLRWFELTGKSLAETEGLLWQELLHPEDRARCAEAWAASVETGAPLETTGRFRRDADGLYRWHLGRAMAQRTADGAVFRWYGSWTDIEDERALSDEAARARDKAQEATRLKDEFLATLSHELRTPLNAILGWARLLRDGTLPEAQRPKALETVVRNAMSQSQLIEDLLDVSRIISGKLRIDVEPVQLVDIIEAALDVVRPAADARGVRLQPILDIEAGLVVGDAARLQQVLWNLLSNAVKFTPKGGRVHVTLRRVESAVEIAVADTGAGIAPAFLPHVFDRFRQEDGTITRRTGGLGLGLAIVRHIVELHGGTVDAESPGDGAGSTFTVRLPVAPIRAPSPDSLRGLASPSTPEPRSAHPALVGLKVLVVDDEDDARELVRLVLEGCSAVATVAATAAEALELIPRVKPDVIVSDIGIPGEDGYSLIRKVRALSREQGGRTPAVALTAYARPEDRTRALRAGFQSHASKPIDVDELLVVVANLALHHS